VPKNLRRHCWVPAIGAMLLSGCYGGATLSKREDSVGTVLVREFETVIYAKAKFLTAGDGQERLPKEATSYLVHPFLYLHEGLRSLGQNVPADVLGQGEAVFVGAKDFRAPRGLGPVHSRRSYVVVLKRNTSLDLRTYFRDGATMTAVGTVWRWEASLGEWSEPLE
jgi:hypothetical protein